MDPTRRSGPAEGRPATYSTCAEITRRRRISRALDRLLGVERAVVDLDEGDYWHVTDMDLGVPERERIGRELAGAR